MTSHNANATFLYSLQQLVPLPDFVKRSQVENLDGDDTLPPPAFADAARRDYACHTAAATWLSAARFHENRATLPTHKQAHLQERIRQGAAYHGIAEAVEQLWKNLTDLRKQAEAELPDRDFALVVRDENGRTVERRYRLASPADIKQAAQYLRQYGKEFRYDERRTMAERVLAKAAEANLDAETQEFLERTAGFGTCASTTIIEQIQQRRDLLARRGDAGDTVQKLAALADGVRRYPRTARQPDNLRKLASVLDTIDSTLNLKLPPVEDTVFLLTHSKLASLRHERVETATGNVYAVDALERIPVDHIRTMMGEDIAAALSTGNVLDRWKLAEELPALPVPESAILDRLCSSLGIQPVATLRARPNLLTAAGVR